MGDRHARKTGRRDAAALERRRRKAARLLGEGVSQAETARRVGVRRQSVHRWAVAIARHGVDSLRPIPRRGRKTRIDDRQQRELILGLKRGPRALGFDANAWSLALVKLLIEQQYGVVYRKSALVGRLLREAGFEPCSRWGWRSRGARRGGACGVRQAAAPASAQ